MDIRFNEAKVVLKVNELLGSNQRIDKHIKSEQVENLNLML
jgi:hypothetical protein